MKNQAFFEQLSAVIKEKSILNHPFYQVWQAGKLTKPELQEYMKQYYHLESAFPRFQSGVHANTSDADARKVMLRDLVGEEGPETNHVDQLVTFAKALGMTAEEVTSSAANANTLAAIDTILGLTNTPDTTRGMAALATYKEQIKGVAETKETGLKAFYDVTGDEALQFFRTHAKKNTLWHEMLDNSLTEDKQASALDSARTLCDAWWSYLDGVTTPEILARMTC